MKFIVTGATSFIGIELIDYLLSKKHSVVAVCRPSSNGISKLPEGAEIVISEMEDYGDLYKEIQHADVFINLAWGGTGHDGRNVADVQEDNVTYTTAAIFTADKMGCKLFVEAGSQAEYGSTECPQIEDMVCTPFSEYGKAKLRIKNIGFEISEKLNIKYMHLRIFSMFGENDHPWTLVMSALDKMLKNENVALSPCTQNWNFVYVKDAVRMIITLCEKAVENPLFIHEIYNIASDDTRELKQFVERMKLLATSNSKLNYGVQIPQNLVSLQPNMNKTINACGDSDFHSFDEVIKRIIVKKTLHDKGF